MCLVFTRLRSLLGAVIISWLFLRPCTALQAGSQCLPAERSQSEQQTSLNLFAKPLIEYLLDTREPAKFIALGASEAYDQENGKDHDSEGFARDNINALNDEIAPKEGEEEKTIDQPLSETVSPEEEEDRHNFALAKDGAKIIAANKEAKKTSAVLDSDGDTFLKNECKADKWLIIELSQVTKMDTLVLSQNELYSSRIKEFEVRGRNSHPRTEGSEYGKSLNSSQWQLLGRFTASNTKGVQAFKLDNPSWLKYLQIRQLSHHGMEAVCALNDVCVYGKSAAEDLEDRLSQDPLTEETEEAVVNVVETEHPIATPVPLPKAAELPGSVESGQEAEVVEGKEAAGEGDAIEDQPALDHEAKDQPASAGPALESALSPSNASNSTSLKAPEESSQASQAKTLNLTDLAGNKTMSSDNGEKIKSLLEDPNPKASETGSGKDVVGGGKDGSSKPAVEEQLAANSASSTASRHGGSVYDIIVQELKAIKLGQKDHARNLTQLQRNVTAVLGGLALEVDFLATRLNRLDPPVAALLPPENESGAPATVGGNDNLNCSAGEVLDFRETEHGPADIPSPVLKPPTELEILQQEVERIKQGLSAIKRQTDNLLLALAFSFAGGIGVNAAFSATSSGLMTRGVQLFLALIPLCVAGVAWLSQS